MPLNKYLVVLRTMSNRRIWLFFSISVNNFLFLTYACERGVPWVIFLGLFSPTDHVCKHYYLSLLIFLSLLQAPLSFFWGPVKKITSNMHMGFATCFYIFIIEMQACLCTWHWGCPCIKCFWQRLGRFPGATTPPLVQSSPEFVLVTTSELWD